MGIESFQVTSELVMLLDSVLKSIKRPLRIVE